MRTVRLRRLGKSDLVRAAWENSIAKGASPWILPARVESHGVRYRAIGVEHAR